MLGAAVLAVVAQLSWLWWLWSPSALNAWYFGCYTPPALWGCRMQRAQANSVRFGPFTLDLKAGELHKDGRRIRLQEKQPGLVEHNPDEV